MRPSIVTCSGAEVDLRSPDPAALTIADIAFALSHIHRYTGHVGAYSVAEHSIHVARAVPPQWRLEGLLHDAAEAFVGDVSSPLKALLPDYREVERTFESAIAVRFGLDQSAECRAAVKTADLALLRAECDHFGLTRHPAFHRVRETIPATPGWAPFQATARDVELWFLQEFNHV